MQHPRPSLHLITPLALAFVSSATFGAEAPVQANGVPNFHQVNDHIFRGAQPTGQGWDSLAKLGVRVVLDLRRENEDGNHSTAAEAKAVQAAGMRYVNVPMNGIVAPREADVAKVLDLLNGSDPVFVHCKLGKDRTGTVIACYRISHDQWKNKKALDEAKNIGLHWVEVGMKSYISSFRSVVTAGVAVATATPASQN
jgi:tyrosine-protein phosphatase SIW14